MFQGTSAKPQNSVGIAALQSCILHLSTQATFVTFSMEIKHIKKLLKPRLKLYRLPELNKSSKV